MRKNYLAFIFSFFFCSFYNLGSIAENSDTSAYDPWEGVNRKIFWFNEKFDKNLLGPVSHGYDYITPETAQTGITNFFDNLEYPTKAVSDILQLQFSDFASHTGRFLINSTIGILGLVDVATDMGIKDSTEDFGKVFATWGIPEGPYLVLPLFGPSNLRNAVGKIFDVLTSPSYLLQHTNASDGFKFWWPIAGNGLNVINLRNNFDDAIRAGRTGSMDYYLFQQSSYLQHRHGLENGGQDNTEVDSDMDAILKKSPTKENRSDGQY